MYNLSSLSMDYTWTTVDITNPRRSCLVRSSTHFHVIGGVYYYNFESTSRNSVLSLDIQSMKWENVIPNMNQRRGYLSCIFIDGMIYAIAGRLDGWTRLQSIEQISIGEST